ncbi:peroxisomal membrane anchor protein conserved region-domain-containing protein [Tuber brumale]|nr:peroxisomal membrane anchor protein conserved region-domain-containing protein [Tuber brumale]
MREDLINSAVILSDPAVAAAPLEKRIAFLQSKNLTKDEVDAALLRAGGTPGPVSTSLVPSGTYPPVVSPPAPGYNTGYYAPQQYQQIAAGPRDRDWRDWFIMATVTTTIGFGLYHLAKRYVAPMISPPTPPQLETDKALIDAKFAEAFDLLDNLKNDTAALKTAEEERKNRVDAALAEVENVIQGLKEAGKRREDESKRVGDEVRGLRDLIPKALEGQKELQKKSLEDLQTELKSLKQLVMNRTGAARPSFLPNGPTGTPPLDPGSATGGAGQILSNAATQQVLGTGGNALGGLQRKEGSALPFSGRPGIPAWQMAAGAKPSPAVPVVGVSSSGGEGAEASSN